MMTVEMFDYVIKKASNIFINQIIMYVDVDLYLLVIYVNASLDFQKQFYYRINL